MALLDKFLELLRKKEKTSVNHVAITTDGIVRWAKDNEKSIDEACKESNLTIKNTIKAQIKLKIPIVTLFLLHSKLGNLENLSIKIDNLINLFNELAESELIHKNKIKISIIGKWYDLPGRIVEPIKNIIEATRDYDNFFVNFCMNYDGREEIVNACKIIAMQVKSEKIFVEAIDQENIKNNIYSSDFLSPDIIIKNGFKHKLDGLLLWDSSDSNIYFTDRLWPDFKKSDFESAINYFKRQSI